MRDLQLLTFDQLLEVYFDQPGVEAELARRHGATLAVLVVDFTGMVARTNAHGIGHALALAAAARRAIGPCAECAGGALVKEVADTSFYAFESPKAAVIAALDGQRALATFAQEHPAARGHGHAHGALQGCMGLGYGPCLLLPGRDLFGPEVNRAFVLGEDVARPGEVLSTDALLHALGAPPEGVGVFRGPLEREQAAGFPFHVLGDYR
jgi:class 3 adenylate cyclase